MIVVKSVDAGVRIVLIMTFSLCVILKLNASRARPIRGVELTHQNLRKISFIDDHMELEVDANLITGANFQLWIQEAQVVHTTARPKDDIVWTRKKFIITPETFKQEFIGNLTNRRFYLMANTTDRPPRDLSDGIVRVQGIYCPDVMSKYRCQQEQKEKV